MIKIILFLVNSKQKKINNVDKNNFVFYKFETKKIDNVDKDNFREFKTKKINNDDENVNNNTIISFNKIRCSNMFEFNRFRIEIKF